MHHSAPVLDLPPAISALLGRSFLRSSATQSMESWKTGTGAGSFCQLANQLRDKDNSLSGWFPRHSCPSDWHDSWIRDNIHTVLLTYLHFALSHYRYLSFFHNFTFICGDYPRQCCLSSALIQR